MQSLFFHAYSFFSGLKNNKYTSGESTKSGWTAIGRNDPSPLTMLEISRPKDSKHVTNVSNSFLHDLEACLVNLKLPLKLFICSDVLEELESSGKQGKF